ncbi:MAG: hypothetical protein HY812_12270 [Planctomycetes bacterium]|nr:hypothetical protein [Planctomycetota bacterium]
MAQIDGSAPAPRSVYAGLLVLAFSIILFEITLTRVFAIMMWHHLTYMVVSIALLGFGAAGSLLTARGARARPLPAASTMSRCAVAYGFAVMLALTFVTSVSIDSLSLWQEKKNFFALLLIYLIITAPFLLGGLAIGLALTHYARQVNRLYFFDLLGSAAGGGLSVLILGRLGAPQVIMIAGALGVLAGFLFGLAAPLKTLLVNLPALAVAAWVGVAFAGGAPALGIAAASWEVPFAPNKEVKKLDLALLDARLQSPTAEVEVSTHLPDVAPSMGGDFGALDRTRTGLRVVAQDGTAPTIMLENAGEIERFPFLDDSSAGSAYHAFAAAGGLHPDVLVIGVGGGVDVMTALFHQANSVAAVDINAAMIEMVSERYDGYLAGLFREGAHPYSERVTLARAEGRAYVRHRDDRYDIIQMSGVDSFTALSTGAYTLSESYLYTVEAVKEFYAHLKEGGYINYSRFILTYPKKPRETLRLANIAYTALAELGVPDPAAHIAVLRGQQWASTMIKKGPFTAAETAALEAFAEREGFAGFAFDPLHARGAPFPPPADQRGLVPRYLRERLARAGLAERVGDAVLDEAARELSAAFAPAVTGDAAASAAALERALVLLGAERARFAPALQDALAAALEGAAEPCRRHHAVRRDFETLLRGSAAERAAFVASYEYDVSPCTDDTPFFFNYYRYRGLLGGGQGGEALSEQSHYHPDYPVGHMVLVASLGQIVLIAFLLLILPLRSLARAGIESPFRLRFFLYFAALGMGFMFIEICLMQKLVVFLGHPTYSLSVVLTALLGSAGLGSFLGARIERLTRRNLLCLMFALVALVLFTILAVNHGLPLLIGLPFWLRVASAVLLLMPLGLALGMPFPSGIRLVKELSPALLPWAWAINGLLSVFSSIFCIVLSMALGFTNVLLLAALVYALGFLAVPAERAVPDPPLPR